MNHSFKNEKPMRTGPYEMFRASYPSLFRELEATTDKARRKEVKNQLKRLAKRAGVQLGREVK
jgi:hypothetical protein